MKWKEQEVNQTWLVMIKRRASIFFMIARLKALQVAEAYVTIVKRWNQGKNTNRIIVAQICVRLWALS